MRATTGTLSVDEVIDSLLLLVLFGCVTGVTTVLFGFGGGFVTVPIVYAVTRVSAPGDAMHIAVATSTAVMIVNSVSATLTLRRSGLLRRDLLWPLVAFVALGSVLGALAALRVADTVLHLLFALYLGLTIVDSLVRRGFLGAVGEGEPRALPRATATLGGVGIGAVASFLGVGGSVMTVPLLRRRGLPMKQAAALANPLSVPVAVVGTVVYAAAASGKSPGLAEGRLGYVDVVAALALLAGSLPTIAILRRVTPRIPDRAHAIAYVGLLAAALAAVLFA